MDTITTTAGYSKRSLPEKLGFKADGGRLRRAAGEPGGSPLVGRFRARDETAADWSADLGKAGALDALHAFIAPARRDRGAPDPAAGRDPPRRHDLGPWPKQASKVPTDVTEDVVRNAALALDLVDVKVAAIDAVWSGLKLMVRKDRR